jgi:hypothetical protein
LNESFRGFRHIRREGLISSISTGFFLILAGIIFVSTPNLFERILDFFNNFNIVHVPHIEIFLPAPQNPESHLTVYSAAELFSLVWGCFQILILVLRFAVHSPSNKKAETASNVVSWLGTALLIPKFLNETTTMEMWFAYWATIIMLIGVSLIIRAIFLAIAWQWSHRRTDVTFSKS